MSTVNHTQWLTQQSNILLCILRWIFFSRLFNKDNGNMKSGVFSNIFRMERNVMFRKRATEKMDIKRLETNAIKI